MEPPEATATPSPQIDVTKALAFEQQLLSEQNFKKAALAGLASAILGAVIWAVITVATNYQIGWMAVGVGFLVGWTVKVTGKGVTKPFGYLGAGLALLGCLLGNVLSIYGFVANLTEISYATALTSLPPGLVLEAVKDNFSAIDLLFYGIAVQQGYAISLRRITENEAAALS